MKLHIDKKIFVNWKTYACLSIAFIVIFVIVWDYVWGMVNIEDLKYKIDGVEYYTWGISNVISNDILPVVGKEVSTVKFDYGAYTAYYFGLFTMQTNLLIAFWFIAMGLYNNKEGKVWFLRPTFTVSVAIYISVTMLIYNFMLLPTKYSTLTASDWVKQLILHTFAPLAMILYTLVLLKTEGVPTVKDFAKKQLWKLYIYPIIYLIINLIRGEFRYGRGPASTQYPYFFLQIHDKKVLLGLDGWIWLIIATVAIIAIISGLSLGYIAILNKRDHKLKEHTKSALVKTK